MRLLITGGTGTVGSHVVRQLVDLGPDVVVVDLQPRIRFFPELDGRVPIYPSDIRDFSALLEIVRRHRVERIAHVAAFLGRWYDEHPYMSYEANVIGALTVLEVARVAGLERVVSASSRAVYGNVAGTPYGPPTNRPIPEEYMQPNRPYCVFKASDERLGVLYAERGELEFGAVRFSDFYCPERLIKGSTRQAEFINLLILSAYVGAALEIPSGGEALCDPISVRDAARGVVAVALAPALPSRIYNIASGQGVPIRMLVDQLADAFPASRLAVGPGWEFGHPDDHMILSAERARAELGFRPELGFSDGVADFIARLELLIRQGVLPRPSAESVSADVARLDFLRPAQAGAKPGGELSA
jgi:nucleoside-diphosphate-sugar epimerase